MAFILDELPLQRKGPRSPNHELFLKVSDGKAWKIGREDYSGDTINFRNSLQGWCRHKGMKAFTRTDAEGNVYVQVRKNAEVNDGF